MAGGEHKVERKQAQAAVVQVFDEKNAGLVRQAHAHIHFVEGDEQEERLEKDKKIKQRLKEAAASEKKAETGHYVDKGHEYTGVPVGNIRAIVKCNKTKAGAVIQYENLETTDAALNSGHLSIAEAVVSSHYAYLASKLGLNAKPSGLLIGDTNKSPAGLFVEVIPGFCDFTRVNLIGVIAEIEYEVSHIRVRSFANEGPNGENLVDRKKVKAFLTGSDQKELRLALYKKYTQLLELRHIMGDDDPHKGNFAMQLEKGAGDDITGIEMWGLDFDRLYAAHVIAKFKGAPKNVLELPHQSMRLTAYDEKHHPLRQDGKARMDPSRDPNALATGTFTDNSSRYHNSTDVAALKYVNSLPEYKKATKDGQLAVVQTVLETDVNELSALTQHLTPAALGKAGVVLITDKQQKHNYPSIYREAFQHRQDELEACYTRPDVQGAFASMTGSEEVRIAKNITQTIEARRNKQYLDAVSQVTAMVKVFEDDKNNRACLLDIVGFSLAEDVGSLTDLLDSYNLAKAELLPVLIDSMKRLQASTRYATLNAQKDRAIEIFKSIVSHIDDPEQLKSCIAWLDKASHDYNFITAVRQLKFRDFFSGRPYDLANTSTFRSLLHILSKKAMALQTRSQGDFSGAINHLYQMGVKDAALTKSLDDGVSIVDRMMMRCNKLFLGKHTRSKSWGDVLSNYAASKQGLDKWLFVVVQVKDLARLCVEGSLLVLQELSKSAFIYFSKLTQYFATNVLEAGWYGVMRPVRHQAIEPGYDSHWTTRGVIYLFNLVCGLVIALPTFIVLATVVLLPVVPMLVAYAAKRVFELAEKLVRRVTSPVAAAEDAMDFFQSPLGYAVSVFFSIVLLSAALYFAAPLIFVGLGFVAAQCGATVTMASAVSWVVSMAPTVMTVLFAKVCMALLAGFVSMVACVGLQAISQGKKPVSEYNPEFDADSMNRYAPSSVSFVRSRSNSNSHMGIIARIASQEFAAARAPLQSVLLTFDKGQTVVAALDVFTTSLSTAVTELQGEAKGLDVGKATAVAEKIIGCMKSVPIGGVVNAEVLKDVSDLCKQLLEEYVDDIGKEYLEAAKLRIDQSFNEKVGALKGAGAVPAKVSVGEVSGPPASPGAAPGMGLSADDNV